MTDAFEMSASYMSPRSNRARSPTPAAVALRRDSSTMSGLYSTPSARAPRLAAPITLRPSPDPRSITKSSGAHLGHVEHLLDQRLRRRHPDDVLARLADFGFEGGALRRRRRRRGREQQGERRNAQEQCGMTCG